MERADGMRAWMSRTAGGPETLTLEDVPMPNCSDGEVLVRVKAVGLNYPDGLLIRDLYQVRPPRPLTPGSELHGIVEASGSSVRLRRGDVVLGVCGWGALSEYLVLSESSLVRVSSTLPHIGAAAFLFTYSTAYHALHDAGRLRGGETVVVLGAAGGVGSAAVDLAAAGGARVIACASTRDKVDYAVRRGAAEGVVYAASLQPGDDQKAFAAELKAVAPQGVDLVVDPVGGAYTEPALRSLARGGRHLVVGFTAGISRVPLNLALLKNSHIIGVDWRTFIQQEPAANEKNVETLLRMWADGQIEPDVTEVFGFADVPAAVARLESRQAIGKIVIAVEE